MKIVRAERTTVIEHAEPDRICWLVDRGMAKLCLALAGVAGFVVGFAVAVVVIV